LARRRRKCNENEDRGVSGQRKGKKALSRKNRSFLSSAIKEKAVGKN